MMNSLHVPETQTLQTSVKRRWIYLLLMVILLGSIVLRFHLLPIPLERDEGEYAYAGQLILQGIPPYVQLYNMKMPGIYLAYAIILSVFGETPTAIHTGLLFVNLTTILLLFLFTRKLFDDLTALTAAAAFTILSVNPFVHGVFAHAEHFVLLFVMASLLLLLNGLNRSQLCWMFLSGFFSGIAFLMKQPAASFTGLSITFILINDLFRNRPPSARVFVKPMTFMAGVLVPLGLTGLFFFSIGILDKFLFWTFTYAREYVSLTRPAFGFADLKISLTNIFKYSYILCILAITGVFSLLLNKKEYENHIFIFLMTIFSILSITPGFHFREHYFILVLPVASILVALALKSLHDHLAWLNASLKKPLITAIILLVLFFSILPVQSYLFSMTPFEALRLTHTLNPFPESLAIAQYIKENSQPSDKIAVIGSEPQIYFYARRQAATGYIYMYPLMEPQRFSLDMQREMIREIESAKPKYLVFVNITTSWLVKPGSDPLIFNWFYDYVSKYYQCKGLVELISSSVTNYRWNNDVHSCSSSLPLWISIYKRTS